MKEIEKYLQSIIDDHKSPGLAYRLFNKSGICYQFDTGFADLDKKSIITGNTAFHAFSVTKTFTALAVLQLCEQGKLKISDSAKDHLPGFPYSSSITIHHLLTHTAGIPNPVPLNWIHLAEEHAAFDRDLFFNPVLSKNNKAISKPNERFRYSNLGYYLLGLIIENVSGLRYEDYITSRIIKPLGLSPAELGFEIVEADNLAKGYIKRPGLLNLMLGLFINKSKFMTKPEGQWKPFKNYYINGASYGGLIGTADAFVKYLQTFLRPDLSLLSSGYKKILFTENFTNNNKSTGMCTSWFTGQLNGKKYFTHAGGGGGYYCEIRLYPGLELGSVIMFNRTGIRDERILNTVDSSFIDTIPLP